GRSANLTGYVRYWLSRRAVCSKSGPPTARGDYPGLLTLRTSTSVWAPYGGTAHGRCLVRVRSAGVPRATPDAPAFHRGSTSGRRDRADWETSAAQSHRRSGGPGLRRRASFASASRDAPTVHRYAPAGL